MQAIESKWPVCGKCCDVAMFSWMGGAHHCVVARPEEYPDDSLMRVGGAEPQRTDVLEWLRSNADKFVYPDQRGLHYLLWRLIDNAVEEVTGGYATAVRIRLLADGGVEVSDNGRGIWASQPDPFLPTTYRIAAAMPRNGDDTSDARYGDVGGTRAAGVWIVNAFSTRMEVESIHGDEQWTQRYEQARTAGFDLHEATATTGTTVRFWADARILGGAGYDFTTVAQRLRQLALLNSAVTFEIRDERPSQPRSRTFCLTEGLPGHLERISFPTKPVHDSIIHFCGRNTSVDIEVAIRWTTSYSLKIQSFVNNIDTSVGYCLHERGLCDALTKVVAGYAKDRRLMRDTEPDLSTDDVCEGLAAILSVKIAEPLFEDRLGARLADSGITKAVQEFCEYQLQRWFETNPTEADAIADKAIRSADMDRMPQQGRRSHCRA